MGNDPGWCATDPGVGNEINGSVHRLKFKDSVFCVYLPDAEGMYLGMSLDCLDGQIAHVVDIWPGGCIEAFNRSAMLAGSAELHVGDYIVDVNGSASVREMLQNIYDGGPLHLTVVRPREWVARFGAARSSQAPPSDDKPLPLGIELECASFGRTLQVVQVIPGEVEDWNLLNSDLAVYPLDRIIEVNGVRGDRFKGVEPMLQQLRAPRLRLAAHSHREKSMSERGDNCIMEVRFSRPCAGPDRITAQSITDDKGLPVVVDFGVPSSAASLPPWALPSARRPLYTVLPGRSSGVEGPPTTPRVEEAPAPPIKQTAGRQLEVAYCPSGHTLTTVISPSDDFFCSGCECRPGRGNTMYGCRRCEYDLCLECFQVNPQVRRVAKSGSEDNLGSKKNPADVDSNTSTDSISCFTVSYSQDPRELSCMTRLLLQVPDDPTPGSPCHTGTPKSRTPQSPKELAAKRQPGAAIGDKGSTSVPSVPSKISTAASSARSERAAPCCAPWWGADSSAITLGARVYYVGGPQTFGKRDRLYFGMSGEVVGFYNRLDEKGIERRSIEVCFAGNKGKVCTDVDNVSLIEPKMPVDFQLGCQVVFRGARERKMGTDRLVPGLRGEVIGRPSRRNDGKDEERVLVRFEGHVRTTPISTRLLLKLVSAPTRGAA